MTELVHLNWVFSSCVQINLCFERSQVWNLTLFDSNQWVSDLSWSPSMKSRFLIWHSQAHNSRLMSGMTRISLYLSHWTLGVWSMGMNDVVKQGDQSMVWMNHFACKREKSLKWAFANGVCHSDLLSNHISIRVSRPVSSKCPKAFYLLIFAVFLWRYF